MHFLCSLFSPTSTDCDVFRVLLFQHTLEFSRLLPTLCSAECLTSQWVLLWLQGWLSTFKFQLISSILLRKCVPGSLLPVFKWLILQTFSYEGSFPLLLLDEMFPYPLIKVFAMIKMLVKSLHVTRCWRFFSITSVHCWLMLW